MSYISDNLLASEKVLYKIKFFWLYKLEVLLLAIAAFYFGTTFNGTAGFIIFLFGVYKYLIVVTTERAVTDIRILQKKGIIARTTEEIRYSNIETVSIHQSVVDRLLSTGTIKITGRGGIQIEIDLVDEPETVKKEIEKNWRIE